MNDSDAPLTEAQKLKALRQIKVVLCQQAHPTLLACGLTEATALALANEELVALWNAGGEGSFLETHRIYDISDRGCALLTTSLVADPEPLQVSVVSPHKSLCRRIYEATRSGLWDLIKVGFGVFLGWFLKNYLQ